ncbi:WbqC family protein [Kitasatospora purpeofusca]|uniref:WbqC family protein n=1 Tax=Kitasatospora purpeofusca TaxID=67352 RepID=UPI0036B12D41
MYAIHRPNLLPRLSVMAKILAADVWVVLDDVQYARRDYQHRARLGALTGGATRWKASSGSTTGPHRSGMRSRSGCACCSTSSM